MATYKFNTKAIHSGVHFDKATGAIMTPIYQSSTFVQNAPGETIAGYEYSRSSNPTRDALEENLSALENAKFGLAFSSGCAALTCVLHNLEQNSHVVLGDDVYGGTFRLFDGVFKKFGINYTQVDFNDEEALKSAITNNTKLVWLETPTNPTLKIVDLKKIISVVKNHNQAITIAVDNTFATPYLQNPLAMGADIVCHSTTKYIGGHSDVIGGFLAVNCEKLNEKLRYNQNALGACLAPFDAFLLLRSTKTLALRMERHCYNAKILAEFLANHNKVKAVYYPGLETHPNYHIAKEQMRDFGGMISFVVDGDIKTTLAFIKKLKLFSLAESLGGVESLVEHPAIMTHATIPAEKRQKLGIVDGFIRLSVGIEDVEDLKQDLSFALS